MTSTFSVKLKNDEAEIATTVVSGAGDAKAIEDGRNNVTECSKYSG